jgi:alpha-tubulin suppressor-like RCC1 family protein
MDSGANNWVVQGGDYIGGLGIAIDSNSNIIYGSYANYLNSSQVRSYNSSGGLNWQKNFALAYLPAVMGINNGNDILVMRNQDYYLEGWDRNGNALWQFEDLGYPVTDASGNIYAAGVRAGAGATIASFTSNGTERWRIPFEGPTALGYPTISFIDNQRHVYAIGKNKLYAIDINNGNIVWSFQADANLLWAILAPGGKIFMQDGQSTFYWLDTAIDYAQSSWPVAMYGNRRHKMKAWDNLPLPSLHPKGILDPKLPPRIAAGVDHTAVIAADGGVWTWGSNAFGKLGVTGSSIQTRPVAVQGVPPAKAIAMGGYHTLMAAMDGTVWAWGILQDVQWDTPPPSQVVSTPGQVAGLSNIISVSAGFFHSMALNGDGTVWTWGNNKFGQLGDGTRVNSNVPRKVSGLSDIVAIGAGGGSTIAYGADGTVWLWGSNQYGEQGDGSKDDRLVPTRFTQVAGASQLAVWGHTVAVKQDGTLEGFGNNDYGYLLGDPSNPVDILAPTAIAGIDNVVMAAAMERGTLALRKDGTVWGWGDNWYQNWGPSPNRVVYPPVPTQGLTDVVTISALGGFHAVALKSDGSIWTWGSNFAGQLGDGTTTLRDTAVQVLGIPQ